MAGEGLWVESLVACFRRGFWKGVDNMPLGGFGWCYRFGFIGVAG